MNTSRQCRGRVVLLLRGPVFCCTDVACHSRKLPVESLIGLPISTSQRSVLKCELRALQTSGHSSALSRSSGSSSSAAAKRISQHTMIIAAPLRMLILSLSLIVYRFSFMSESPRPVVFCGPSGVGKGTLINLLMERFPNEQFGFSVSHTTRKPREGEENGVHYHFATTDAMKKEIDAGKFIEHANVHGNYYGTSVAAVESVQKAGKVCILDIDVQGVKNVKKSDLNPIYLFIAPPSMEALEARLRGRGTETEEQIKKRLANAAQELEYGQQAGNFDRVFINADLKATFADMAAAFNEWYPQLMEVAEEDGDTPKSCTSKTPCVIS